MQEKGKILIVEDRLEEKIGSFYDKLVKANYSIEVVETLEKADIELNKLLKSNELCGIILDFSFPVNDEDQSVTTNDEPNGIALLKKYLFNINNRRVPVIINTTGDEEYKKKYLSRLSMAMPTYDIDYVYNSLAMPTPKMVEQIINMFDTRNRERNIKPDNSWNKSGPFIRGPHGEILGYRD